ncbi:MAG: DNA polymerase III subunit gamma/tau [candidate division Zixibacteria bacterium]|nr:DNA polymerase III subunit gamma/tau [candidate division Zixibacteria bacterium]
MSYYVFARKYRPQKFADVVAQKHITETLTKAIENDRVSQAYLFCGVRGTGKTSIARILAKRLNCASPQGAEPCDQCESCLAIVKGRSLDILEIDAASHTSVDDIRELRESIKYAPTGGKHKIYIIDEVHRLSPSAFDALLKTLEEPPAHAVFIFATTEVHKVPQTILSRCQRYDFKRISESELKAALKEIADKEGLKITDEALAELAKRGDGSLRDSLSILDQVASWQHDIIDEELLTEALGIVPRGEYAQVLRLIRQKNTAEIITKVNAVLNSGIDASEFVRGFQQELRILLVLKAAPNLAADYGITTEEVAQYDDILQGYSLNDLLRIQNLLVNLEQKIRDGFDPVINIELAMLKLVAMEDSVTLESVLRQLAGNPGSPKSTNSLPQAAPKTQSELSSPDPAPVLPLDSLTSTPSNPPTASSAVSATSVAPADLASIWSRFLQALKTTHRNLQIKLTLAEPRSIDDNKITVAFDRFGEVHVRQLQDRDIQKTLEHVIKGVTGKTYHFQFFVDKNLAHRQENGNNVGLLAESEKPDHPAVVKAMEVFDAEIVGRQDLADQ